MNSKSNFNRYAIKQSNYKDKSFLNSKYSSQILQLQAYGFAENCPMELFKRFLSECFGSREIKYQLLFLVDTETDTVVSSYEIFIKETDLSNVINCVVSAVCTHPEYRKKGLMEYLIGETMKKYETPSYKFTGSDQHDEYEIDEFVNAELNKDGISYFWTLYSAVKEYYSRFGFKSVRNVNWLTSKIDLSLAPADFKLLDNESFLSRDDVVLKLASPGFLPDLKAIKPNQISVPLTAPTFAEFFIDRDILLLKHYGRPAEVFGLSIITKNKKAETFVVIASDVQMQKSLIGRLFTTVKDKEILADHLQRIIKFSEWHEKNYHGGLPFTNAGSNIGYVKLTTNDIFTTDSNGAITDFDTDIKSFIVNWLKHDQEWSYDDSNDSMLAMLKEFGKDGFDDEVEWVHNGLWCFD